MTLQLYKEKIQFDFPTAKELFRFDEEDRTSPYFHGLSHCMKGVDAIGVFDNFQVWIEVKEFPNGDIKSFSSNPDNSGSQKHKGLARYLNDLVLKFRDTYLYRFCELQTGLPITYIFLTNLPDDLCLHCQAVLAANIPSGKANPKRWKKEILDKDLLFVVNTDMWNQMLNRKFGTCTQLP